MPVLMQPQQTIAVMTGMINLYTNLAVVLSVVQNIQVFPALLSARWRQIPPMLK